MKDFPLKLHYKEMGSNSVWKIKATQYLIPSENANGVIHNKE